MYVMFLCTMVLNLLFLGLAPIRRVLIFDIIFPVFGESIFEPQLPHSRQTYQRSKAWQKSVNSGHILPELMLSDTT